MEQASGTAVQVGQDGEPWGEAELIANCSCAAGKRSAILQRCQRARGGQLSPSPAPAHSHNTTALSWMVCASPEFDHRPGRAPSRAPGARIAAPPRSGVDRCPRCLQGGAFFPVRRKQKRSLGFPGLGSDR